MTRDGETREEWIARATWAVHAGFLARWAEHKLGLSPYWAPEPSEDPDAQPGACVVCHEPGIEWGCDIITAESVVEHFLPPAPERRALTDEEAGHPVHITCIDRYLARLGVAR